MNKKIVDVSKKVRVRPNQGCSRKRAGRSQPGINCKSQEEEKGGTLVHPNNSEFLTEL
jgi:hypothetical protein